MPRVGPSRSRQPHQFPFFTEFKFSAIRGYSFTSFNLGFLLSPPDGLETKPRASRALSISSYLVGKHEICNLAKDKRIIRRLVHNSARSGRHRASDARPEIFHELDF
jgi:hypothetical protein